MLNRTSAEPERHHPLLAGQPARRILHLPRNTAGTDYFVGDLHGRFDLLEAELAARRFDPSADRLIATGDLVDRGADASLAIDYLMQPWFVSIRGNHEQMLLNWLEPLVEGNYPDKQFPESRAFVFALFRHVRNGGQWAVPTLLRGGLAVRRRWFDAISALPFAIDVETPAGCFGVLHAEPPRYAHWRHVEAALARRHGQEYVLWSRYRILRLRRGIPLEPHLLDCPDRDRVLVGHSVVLAPIRAGSMVYLDTGSGFEGGRLSVLTGAEIMGLPDSTGQPGFDGRLT